MKLSTVCGIFCCLVSGFGFNCTVKVMPYRAKQGVLELELMVQLA